MPKKANSIEHMLINTIIIIWSFLTIDYHIALFVPICVNVQFLN